jgi:hypothetical protein
MQKVMSVKIFRESRKLSMSGIEPICQSCDNSLGHSSNHELNDDKYKNVKSRT